MKLIHGGRVLRPDTFECTPADIVVDGDTIRDIVAPGTVKDANARRIDAADRALIPGLVNGHNHAQTSLAKGLFDRYTLELYLNAVPVGHRPAHAGRQVPLGGDRRGRDGAQGLHRRLRHVRRVSPADRRRRRSGRPGYADVGMRASVATMMADKSFHEAIPGLPTRSPSRCASSARR